jgi:hypothetical protein
MIMHAFRSRLAVAAATGLLLVFASTARAAIDYTDIWYAAGNLEPGWGANFAHTGDVIFVTFFIYDTKGAPVWYTAQLSRTTGGTETFSGPVYAITGTWFGAPTFPPVTPVAVGDATFTATSSYAGQLRYRVDTVTVTKSIERQTTTEVVLSGTGTSSVTGSFLWYLGGMARTYTGTTCPLTPGTYLNPMQLGVSQVNANTLYLEFRGADSTNVNPFCAMQGATVQYGKILTIPSATYQCTSGINTTVVIDSLRKLDNGIEMHWHASIGGACVEQGKATAVTQQ